MFLRIAMLNMTQCFMYHFSIWPKFKMAAIFKSKSIDAHKISSFGDIKFISMTKCVSLKATKSNKETVFHLTFSIMADIQNGCHFFTQKKREIIIT